ncbi:F-box and leucine-rich repeat protein GRR1 [Cryptococcus neoformans Tu401-1]|nr:F-box and leucine-rich repeat protein GRR1 [Cryptococcus neoformans var. grubii Tu401-1]OXM79816.1 F-box and leucine-rich repeat protein GRR1 [Cryptococcus neoformans var. grubii Bt63]
MPVRPSRSNSDSSIRHMANSSPASSYRPTSIRERETSPINAFNQLSLDRSLTPPKAPRLAPQVTHDPKYTRHIRSQVLRNTSGTPSAASTDDEDDQDERGRGGIDEEAKSWLELRDGRGWKRNGKYKGVNKRGEIKNDLTNQLPPEILIQIFRYLPGNKDLLSVLLVSRFWCLCAFSLLWYKPTLPTITQLASIIRVIHSPTRSLPYANAIRRLPLIQLGPTLTDELFTSLSVCSRLERLNISGADKLTSGALRNVIACVPNLVSLDLTGVINTDDAVLVVVGETCKKLQAINLSECRLVGDEGVLALAKESRVLRRIKFDKCHRITQKSLIPLIRACPLVLEYDLQDVISLSSSVLHTVFLHASHLRELRVNGCVSLDENCIPNLLDLSEMQDDWIAKVSEDVGIKVEPAEGVTMLRPVTTTFEYLRVVDMTGCTDLGDKAVDNLITNAPKLRQLTLNKCPALTDKSLESIGKLGKHLHNLHLGHVSLITDDGVINLAKSCTRLRYLDLACCTLLTDACVAEIGENMPKLKRFGLVKVTNITDEAIYSLVRKHTSLERVHLSYCDQLSVKAIAYLLNKLAHIKHLSLTGVSSFKVPELQEFCRPPPDFFNDHQRAAFCVFSGSRVVELRDYLNNHYLPSMEIDTSEDSGHDGAASSTSSLTIPRAAPTPDHSSISNSIPQHSSLVYRRSLSNLNDAWEDAAPPISPTPMSRPQPPHLFTTSIQYQSAQPGENAPFPIASTSTSPPAFMSSSSARPTSNLTSATPSYFNISLSPSLHNRFAYGDTTLPPHLDYLVHPSQESSRSSSISSNGDRLPFIPHQGVSDRSRGPDAPSRRDRPSGPRVPSGSYNVSPSFANEFTSYWPGEGRLPRASDSGIGITRAHSAEEHMTQVTNLSQRSSANGSLSSGAGAQREGGRGPRWLQRFGNGR